MASNSYMPASVGVVIEIEHPDLGEVVRLSDQTRRICDEADIFELGRANRTNAAPLPAKLRFGQQAVTNGQWFVRKFVYPVHVLAFNEKIHWVKVTPETDCHVVIQKVGGLRYFQIDRCLLVFELEFQLAFEEKPIRQLPEKKRVESGIEKWILPAACCEVGRSVTSHEKLRAAGKCFLHLHLERLHFLTQFLRGGFGWHGYDLLTLGRRRRRGWHGAFCKLPNLRF